MADGGASLYFFLAATAATAYASYESGQAVAAENKARAEEEKLAANDREIERRGKLLRALASRNVSAGAGNFALEGTQIALVNRDLSEFNLDQLSDSAMTRARIKSLNAAGSSAKRIGTIKAAGSLFSGASATAGAFTKAPATLGKVGSTSSSSGGYGRMSGA